MCILNSEVCKAGPGRRAGLIARPAGLKIRLRNRPGTASALESEAGGRPVALGLVLTSETRDFSALAWFHRLSTVVLCEDVSIRR